LSLGSDFIGRVSETSGLGSLETGSLEVLRWLVDLEWKFFLQMRELNERSKAVIVL
jgi:hypothetical protein